MKSFASFLKLTAASVLLLAVFTGCESTEGSGSVHGSVYYGVGFYDPWYYGGYYDDPDIIVCPPDHPVAPVEPTHPIVKPAPAPRPTPMPSRPRPMPRR